jgi:tetraacyldisaccharide 4'-kinase
MGPPQRFRAWVEATLTRHWAQSQPTWLARLLQPVAILCGVIARRMHKTTGAPHAMPVPVLVVGNFTVGGSGKTPTVIALVQALQAAGQRPGVISRGHGRRSEGAREVSSSDNASEVGDEPLLIQRRTRVPVWVARQRSAAALALCAKHPEVNVLIADDGLQHHALARDAELVVFDERGAGNGLLLPAGPLREPLPNAVVATMRVLYTHGRVNTKLPGATAQRAITQAWPLRAWLQDDVAAAVPLMQLRGRPLLAVAGLAAPDKFFSMLEAAGLRIERLPLADHFAYTTLPWPAQTRHVITTEKDAIKIDPQRLGITQLWVVPLDLALPPRLLEDLMALLHLTPTVPAPHEP